MPTIVMYWDEIGPLGDPVAGIRIENNFNIRIPADACGFRLNRAGQPWTDYWYFAGAGAPGSVFSFQGVSYDADFLPITPVAIEARGPVNGCTAGAYVFVTPLSGLGGAAADPVTAGAGSFRADFTLEADIEWLDSAGEVLEVELPEPSLEPIELPPEFFEEPPSVKGCIRDFDEHLHCPEDADSTGRAAGAPFPSVGGMALLIGQSRQLLPELETSDALSARAEIVGSGQALEVLCPSRLHLTTTFFKATGFDPATVRYRFAFAHGPVSTAFSVVIDDDGPTQVFHSVPLPLPKPAGSRPGGRIDKGPSDFAIYEPPIDPIGPGSGGAGPGASVPGGFMVEPLPDGVHKGSVKVEILNVTSGVVASGWASYHIVCVPGSDRPRVTPGLIGSDVIALQSGINPWLIETGQPPLRLDGRFGGVTEDAVRAFQRDRALEVDGMVGPKTWRAIFKAMPPAMDPDGCAPGMSKARSEESTGTVFAGEVG